MDEDVSRASLRTKRAAARLAGRVATREKWPIEVREMKKGVMQGYRHLVEPSIRLSWRSLKGKGFWLTAKGMGMFYGRTLREATLNMMRSLPEYQDCTVMD